MVREIFLKAGISLIGK